MPGALRGIGDDGDGDDDGGGNNWAHCDESVEAAGGVGGVHHCVSTFNFQMALSRNNVLLFFLFPLLFRRSVQGSGPCSGFHMQRVGGMSARRGGGGI